MQRVRTGKWFVQSDGKGARPWFVIRSKANGTAECLKGDGGRVRRWKDAIAANIAAAIQNRRERNAD